MAAICADFGPSCNARKTEAGEPPRELWDALAERGYLGVNLPERWGGGGMGMSGLAAVAEEIAAAGCALLLLVVSPAIVGNRIANHGSPEQQEAWLTGIASGDLRVAFAITEAEAGSNAHNLRTAARREGDRYMLRGEETAILGRRGCSRGPCRRP